MNHLAQIQSEFIKKASKQIGKLYHFTDVGSLISILKTNKLGLTEEEAKDI